MTGKTDAEMIREIMDAWDRIYAEARQRNPGLSTEDLWSVAAEVMRRAIAPAGNGEPAAWAASLTDR